jgi:ABC-type sugar transport systems, permease components
MRRRRGGAAARRDGVWPWVFVLPLVCGVALFYLWPILQTAFFSFTTWGVFGGFTWSGFDNYVAWWRIRSCTRRSGTPSSTR